MAYTANEYFDMVRVLGWCEDDSYEAAREYARRYPNRQHPRPNVFRRLEVRARETGRLLPVVHHDGGGHLQRNPGNEEAVLNRVFQDPTLSTRQIARELQLSKSTVFRILKSNQFHPFHYSIVQKLEEGDLGRRLEYCQWLQRQNIEFPGFSERILFTDECIFTQEGIFNCHNYHWWNEVNPHVIREGHHQHRWKINVWAGIIGDRIIGPYLLPQILDGPAYTVFLRNVLEELLDDVPLVVRRQMWYQHDGAPPHYA